MSLIHQREDLKTYQKKHIDLKKLSYNPFIQIFGMMFGVVKLHQGDVKKV
jgi:hypothetical protein